ncbi:MAG: hypothetical protein P4L35_01940 [Ignavibacteriaceae bacterium]|nr:hypothetical protein [Ignavibacteriaceae bacterium]
MKLNVPMGLELLFEEPVVGQSTYGDYYLYAVKQGNNEEYNFFAPEELHEQMKGLHKGNKVEITKLAEQKGSKIITKYDLKLIANGNGNGSKKVSDTEPNTIARDNYFDIMLASYLDALRIQENLNGMVDVNKIAVCLFIARSKVNANALGG